jgi:hypothetical protein
VVQSAGAGSDVCAVNSIGSRNSREHAQAPVILSGSDIAYFTGKMENYFRVRGIPYELRNM